MNTWRGLACLFAVVPFLLPLPGDDREIAAGGPKRAELTPRPFFVENAGQLEHADVEYYLRTPSLDVGFAPGRVLFNALRWERGEEETQRHVGGVLFELRVGDGSPRPQAKEPLPGRSHRLHGSDPDGWQRNLRHYGRIVYPETYPGIDLVYFFDDEGRLTYEFLVSPGADPSQITLEYSEIEGLELAAPDAMEITTGVGRLRDGPLVCFQERDGSRQVIKSAFRKSGESTYTVALLEDYDRSRPLVVDPTLEFATYFGFNGATNRTISIDPAGNIYMAGGAYDAAWPTTAGAYQTTWMGPPWPDVFAVKFDPNGNVIWSTLIGGPNEDYCYVSEVNAQGELYLAGRGGDGFPTTPGAFDRTFNGGQLIPNVHSATDAFVTRLSADGSSLVYSTYIGTSDNDVGRASHLLPTGELLVGGTMRGTDLPTTPGVYQPNRRGSVDGYVAKVSADGSSLDFCTYFGANNDNMDFLFSIGLDATGNIWVAGSTDGSGGLVPTANAFQPVHGGGSTENYVGKLSPDGTNLVYFSWLGGSGHEFIETEGQSDAQGNFYIAGGTSSPNFPFSPGAYQSTIKGGRDGFVMRVNNDGTVGMCTAYGGTSPDPDEQFWGPAFDQYGNVYATGRFPSTDCPMTANAFQPTSGGGKDVVFAAFSPDGTQLLYATYLGGSGNDTGRFIRAYPDSSAVVLAIVPGGNDMPLLNPTQANTSGAFLAKFDITDLAPSGPGALSVSPSGGLVSSGDVGGPFSPASATYTVSNMGGSTINWTASATQGWVGVSPAGGTLAPGANASVTVLISGGAAALGAGTYSDAVSFTNTTNGNGDTSRTVDLTVTVPGSTPTIMVNTLAGTTATIDFAAREYLTLAQNTRGNEAVTPVVIGAPSYTPAPGGMETTVWTFVDGATAVDSGFTWMSSQTGNAFSLPLTGDATPRTVKLYMGIYHFSGSLDYVVSAGTTSTTISQTTTGRTLYEIEVTFSGNTTVAVQPSGSLQYAGFEMAAARVESSSTPPVDSDGDGYSDAAETAAGSDPFDPASTPIDIDGDGLLDAWENANFGNISGGPTDDPDGDGATNLAEFNAGTDPNVWDTDGDGFSDGAELAAGSDPLDPLSTPSTGGGGGGGGSSGCGATGLEFLLVFLPAAVSAWHRRRFRQP